MCVLSGTSLDDHINVFYAREFYHVVICYKNLGFTLNTEPHLPMIECILFDYNTEWSILNYRIIIVTLVNWIKLCNIITDKQFTDKQFCCSDSKAKAIETRL